MLGDWNAILASLAIVNAMIAVWNLSRGKSLEALGTGVVALSLASVVISHVMSGT
jgi:hypothetical protein